LRVKLRHLDSDNQKRIQLAHNYSQAFADLPIGRVQVQKGASHVYHLYVIVVQQRTALMNYLKKANIIAGIHYPVPVHKMPAYMSTLNGHNHLNITEKIADQVLSLPLYVGLSHSEQTKVINTVREFFSASSNLLK
jgi:dTDP-4-amino-4,6-dideoxygalactose transaminase